MPRQLRRGDLRIIAAPDGTASGSRVGLVLAVDLEEHVAEIALVHPYRELATSLDGVVPGARAGTPYDVVVQTDLRGVVWVQQAARLVGQLAAGTLEEISDLIERGGPESARGIRIGTPLVGRHDRRWPFKVAEGQALDRLTSHCTRELLEGPPTRRRTPAGPSSSLRPSTTAGSSPGLS